jgi:hypothetical protein
MADWIPESRYSRHQRGDINLAISSSVCESVSFNPFEHIDDAPMSSFREML